MVCMLGADFANAFRRRTYANGQDRTNAGGPTQAPKDQPTDDRDFRKAQSRDELQERSVEGERPASGGGWER